MAQVAPAGIPGVETIELHERFRIVATVNDASNDDIVFPISEGLARRFVRIEMSGAPLRSWVGGGQAHATAVEDAPYFIRVRRLVSLCFGPARRNPQVRTIQKRLMDIKEIE